MAKRGMANPQGTENDETVQQAMYRTLLETPHRRDVDRFIAVHREQFERDPNFYGHLAVWAVLGGNNTIRDLDDIFTAVMLVSPYPEHREAGYVMFQTLPPHQAARAINYFTGYDERICHHSYDPPMLPNDQNGMSYSRAKYGINYHDKTKVGTEIPREVIQLGAKSRLRRVLLQRQRGHRGRGG